jgi:ABC-type lipoprotein export system ATPase subunit
MEKKVMELLSRINREKKTTVVQVTHSRKVASYGSRIIYLADGEITTAPENGEEKQ